MTPLETDRLEATLKEFLTGCENARIRHVSDRQDIAIGECGVRVIETPGHTVGGVVYWATVLCWPTTCCLWGCGRSDLAPGENTRNLWRSLNRLMALPEETKVYPGHNYGKTPTSSIGREILENPYLKSPDFEAFRARRERR